MEKINLDTFVDNFTDSNDAQTMSIYNKIINELNQSLGINVRHPQISDDYYNFDAFMQIAICCYYQNPVYYKTFNKIVPKYNFNEFEFLDYAIKLISKETQNAENFVNGLLDIGIIDGVFFNDNKMLYTIESSKLSTIHFYRATDFYKDSPSIIKYIKNKVLSRNHRQKNICHNNTLFLLTYSHKGEAITVKQKNSFGYEYYHSYYRDGDIIVDLNINAVMPQEDYNKIYHPEIISIVTDDEVKAKYDEVQKNAEHTLFPLLAIAAYEELKTQENFKLSVEDSEEPTN